MIGRVTNEGTIIQWEPYGAAMCDALVQSTDGRLCWHASYALKPIDGLGPLPDRREAQEKRRLEMLASLEAIRAQHVARFRSERWPGCEFAKAIIGKALDGAIAKLKGEK